MLWSEVAFDVTTHLRQPSPGCLMTFVHLNVFDWRPSVLRHMRGVWPRLRASLPQTIFCQGAEDDAKFQRFIALFDWHFVSDCPCSDGKNRRIYFNRRPHGQRKF